MPFSPRELQRWRDTLLANRSALDSLGIDYLFIPVPNKHRVHKAQLPRYARCDAGTARLNQLADALTAADGFPYLDLRTRLVAANETEPLYHRSNTHWNDRGILLAYAAIVERLKPVHRLRDLRDQAVLVPRQRHLGDLAVMLGMDRTAVEASTAIHLPDVRATREADPLPFDFNPRIRITAWSRPVDELATALVFHDSFGVGAFAGLLAESFSRVVFVHRAAPQLPFELIEQIRPDVVIHEMVERALLNRYFDPPR